MTQAVAGDAAALDARAAEGFSGHPKGLYFLAFTEMWERFSFYGMRALLVLYMVQDLLISERINNVAGMGAYRAFIEAIFGPLSTQAFASQTFGLYAGFVYFTPLFGGLIADRWLGPKKTVMIGIMLMTAGHFAMVFDASFLIALVLLVLGSGALKGNIAAQVGQLYPDADEALRSRGYTIFSTGINVGAFLGPLICGALAQVYGWHYGFGMAGIMMLAAAIVYFAGMRNYADFKPAREHGEAAPITSADWRRIGWIVVALFFMLGQYLAYDQLANVGMIWVGSAVDLSSPVGAVPAPWFASEDALASIIAAPILLMLWGWQARRKKEPDDIGKMAIGAFFMGLSMLSLAIGAWFDAQAGQASIIWPIIAFFFSGFAFMWSWPTMLALVSQHSPRQINALMMAGAYLTAFASSVGAGFIARWYEPLGATNFFLLNSGISFGGGLALALLGPMIGRRLAALEASGT